MATEFPIKANTQSAEQSIERLIVALRKAGKEAGMAEKEIDEMVESTTAARQKGVQNINSMNQGLNNLGNTVKNVAKGAVALFALDQLRSYGSEIISITAQFQKFEALLTNTLGSRSQAQMAMAQLTEQAAKTNFSLTQVVEGFLKLQNNGIKPTNKELTSFFDLTNNAGKQFDQFVEAVNDATRGEFERLKEFFIDASKEGDKVIFTFRGQTFEADRNAESIKNVLVQLGELQGVAGSTAALSAILTGRISNLGDAWNQFLATIGSQQTGLISSAIGILTESIESLTDVLMTDEQRQDRTRLKVINASLEQFKKTIGDDLPGALRNFQAANEESIRQLEQEAGALLRAENIDQDRYNAKIAEKRLLIDLGVAVNEYVAGLQAENEKSADAAAAAARAKRLENLEKEAKAREKINEKLREYLQLNLQDPAEEPGSDVNTLGATNPQSLFGFLFGAELNRIGQGARDEINAADQAAFDAAQLRREIDLENEISHQAAVRDARRQTLDYSLMAINEVFRSRAIGIQNELTMLQQAANAELSLAGNNKEAKQRIAVEFERKQRELLTKQVAAEQEAALFTTLINMGPGIAKTIGTLGMPAAIPFIAAVAALIGLQQANIRKAQRPRFAATGEFDIDGPGTETSDSIPYFLSKRESVVHARGTKKFGDIIKPIIEDAATDWHDIKRIVDLKLPGMSNMVVVQPHVRDTGEVVQELREVKRTIQNKKEWHWHITEQGLRVAARQGEAWDTYVNKRYSSD